MAGSNARLGSALASVAPQGAPGGSSRGSTLPRGEIVPQGAQPCSQPTAPRVLEQASKVADPITPPPLTTRRVVFVASFSGVRFWPDPWHRPLGAATYTVMQAPAEG